MPLRGPGKGLPFNTVAAVVVLFFLKQGAHMRLTSCHTQSLTPVVLGMSV